MQSISIIVLCILSCITYGIVHDQVTARICVEYFTIGHPPVFATASPTLLGIGWGIIASWWVGLILGLPLALAARAGRWPKRNAGSLVKPLACLLLACALGALLAGLIGHQLAASGKVWLMEPLASLVPKARHVAFLTDLWAHDASYLLGFLGGFVLAVVVFVSRVRQVTYVSRL
jgi:hypothetical protein